MIGRLHGILVEKNPPHIVMDVQGVGYEIEIPLSTTFKLPEIGQTLLLHTHTHIREDAYTLYGFFEEKEKILFRILIKVSGVGPKMALSILSGIEVNTFIRCIQFRDFGPLTGISGVGKKTAERLVLELASKLKGITSSLNVSGFNSSSTSNISFQSDNSQPSSKKSKKSKNDSDHLSNLSNSSNSSNSPNSSSHDFLSSTSSSSSNSSTSTSFSPIHISPEEETFSALLALGYRREEALRALTLMEREERPLTSESLLRSALKNLAKG